jgi:transposase
VEFETPYQGWWALDLLATICSAIAIKQTADSAQPRPEGEFFAKPSHPTHRRYEALRALLLEGLSVGQAAELFGYTPQTLTSMVRDFRAGRRDFFLTPRPGPKSSPAKDAARASVIELRRQGHSVYEIAQALQHSDTPLNRTGVAEICRQEGFERLWPRPHAARGAPRRETLERAEAIDFEALPSELATSVAGLFLAIPELVRLDLPGLVRDAGYPGTRAIPALSSVLSLLALKLVAKRRLSHVYDLASDPGASLFAGLVALPKATALTTYSYRLSHARQREFLAALGRAMLGAGLAAGAEFDLDFHAIMHYGEGVGLEEHYVPRRSQRTASVLTFFAQDSGTHNLVYANADLLNRDRNQEVLAFSDHWRRVSGHDPSLLVLDSKVTTHSVLGQLDQRGIRFLTLRMRLAALLKHLDGLQKTAWSSVRLDRAGGYRQVQVAEELADLSDYPGQVRQLAVRGLGHEQPTILITNDRSSSTKQLIERYADRMIIEQRLAESIRAFHLDALASAVPLNVDLDVVLSVLAGAVCAGLRQRLRGYATATPDTLQRRFLSTGGHILHRDREIIVRLDRRTYSPILRQADIAVTEVPWWGGRRLRFEFA